MIELMKFDMGGSAAVFGAAKAIGQIKPLGVEVCYLNHPVYFFLFKGIFFGLRLSILRSYIRP
jgi:hypothetical protein